MIAGVPPSHTYSAETGAGDVWFLSDHLALTRLSGNLDAAMASWCLARYDEWMADRRGALVAFQDWALMTGYEMKARLLYAAWVLQNRGRFEALHLHVQSKVIELGATMTNLAIGRTLVMHTTRATFDGELRAAAARARVEVPR